MELYFILAEPAVPENVGASARAIKTMGFNRLRLVNPCDHLSTEARMLAHGSNEVLEEAEVFQSLEEALNDIDLSIATTAKKKDARVDYHLNSELPGLIKAKGSTIQKVGLIFGREESGLSNDEIRMCNLASGISMQQAYPSLNLSQSVMIYAYTLAGLGSLQQETGLSGVREAEFRTMMNRSEALLRKLEIHNNPALYNRILERIALLTESDVHLLLSVLGKLD